MTTRIADMFARRRARRDAALIPFFTVGDPDLATTRDLVRAALAEGADAIELGVPFSDPMADGPVLQRAASRALAAGTTLPRVLELVGELRREYPDPPFVLFGYYNPFFRYGVDAIARDAAAAGADAFLCVDLPPEEGADLREAAGAHGLDLIATLAPTTPPARIRTIARAASGFLYFVSLLGTTGVRAALPPELPARVARVRGLTDLPVGVGFGVSQPEQAAWIAGFADAVIVGSALARLVETAGPRDAPSRVADLVARLRGAVAARDGA
ncbi:MAG TPA: tryptophan synthase subunit alpha [Candidatus Binatia bacterium]|jgi:tryptophan synthase alpha chain|nr:tryptophan synthase subunit alpha [Candidatus Binatia bacterium]